MGETAFSNVVTLGSSQKIPSSYGGNGVPDPSPEAGPAVLFQGLGVLDPRVVAFKDSLNGYTGSLRGMHVRPLLVGVDAVPAALGAANIAAAANAVSGTAMTLATAVVAGITPRVPFLNSAGAVITSGLALDFGFAIGNVTAASKSVPVGDGSLFSVGMPLVIGGVGNAAGTTCLLTWCTAISSNTITINDAPLATNTAAPIGTGNVWPTGEYVGSTAASNIPTAHNPYIAAGVGLFFDPRQGIARGVRIVGAGGSAGGNFLVSGYDVYGVAMSELITVAAASTGWGAKAFKYITSVTPQFSDAFNYTVGTSDVFGGAYKDTVFEHSQISWALSELASDGWVAAVTTSPATTTTGDVRQTIQIGANGGSALGAPGGPSNGAVSSLLMAGRRLYWQQSIPLQNIANATIDGSTSLFGVAQA